MLRLLFRLWWLQQRRSFTWKDAVVGGYLIFVYVMVGLGFYFGATLDGEELFEDGTPDALCAILELRHACAHAPHAFLDAQRASGHCGLSADAGFLFHQWHLCHLLL